VDKKADKKAAAEWREKQKVLKNAVNKAEREMTSLIAERKRIDAVLSDPKSATGAEAKLTTSQLMVKRADVEKKLEAAEEVWMEAGAALEAG
jgi:ATP-binding cassette subfamily F protein 3